MIERQFPHGDRSRRREGARAGTAVAAVVASALVGALWAGLPDRFDTASAERVSSRGSLSQAVHVVAPGDTFWSLAERLEPGRDPRPLVDALVRAHGGPVLRAGDRIALPHPLHH